MAIATVSPIARSPWNLGGHLTVVLLVLAARLPFIIWFPTGGGDSDIYTTVAENILRGCGVSLSEPTSENCVPHFGGNQGPGFPFFLASVWWLTGHSDVAVRLIQSLIFAIAAGYGARAMALWTASRTWGFALGALLAYSPLLIAWPRYLQTETLSLAAMVWFAAAVLLSIHEGRLRIIELGLVLVFATMIRLDSIVLVIPVAVAAFCIHSFRHALWRGAIIALILALPWGLWTARNIAVELPKLYPSEFVMPQGARPPLGYMHWVHTWIVYEYERPGALWGVNRFVYDNITVPDRAFASPDERRRVEELIDRLRAISGAPFPEAIDDEFAAIAQERRANDPVRVRIVHPAIRVVQLWANPYSSFGWPNEMASGALNDENRLALSLGDNSGLLALAAKYPLRAMTKAFTGVYRYLLLASFATICLYAVFGIRDRLVRQAILVGLSYVVARTLFFALIGSVETRYTVQTTPVMELCVLLAAWYWWRRRRGARPALEPTGKNGIGLSVRDE